jgi:hypothetical protein
MSIEDYIEIKPEFTVDKYTDHSAPTAKPGSFVTCDNYIPKRGRIESRLGITVLAHTPDTSWVVTWDPENPVFSGAHTTTPSESGELAICRWILKFSAQSTMGRNALTGTILFTALSTTVWGGYATVCTAQAKQGTTSLGISELAAIVSGGQGSPAHCYGMRAETVKLAADGNHYPGDSANNTTASMITMWIYPLNANAGAASEYYIIFGTTADPAFSVRHFDTNLQFYAANSAGGAGLVGSLNIIAQGQWQFIACWKDFAKGRSGIYHYNDVTKVETWTSATTVPSGSHFRMVSANVTIGGDVIFTTPGGGRYLDDSDAFHGYIDYLTLWDALYTNNTSNVTLARDIRNLHKSL